MYSVHDPGFFQKLHEIEIEPQGVRFPRGHLRSANGGGGVGYPGNRPPLPRSGGYFGSRYTSYWNAFLFGKFLPKTA